MVFEIENSRNLNPSVFLTYTFTKIYSCILVQKVPGGKWHVSIIPCALAMVVVESVGTI